MSNYPTPWRVVHDKRDEVTAFSADNEEVFWFDKHETSIFIDLDDLVARVNAGAEAIERLAFMTKVAEQAVQIAAISHHINGKKWLTTSRNYAPKTQYAELATWLGEENNE